MADARDVLRYPAVRRYLLSTALAAVGLNILVTVLFKQVFDITGNALDIGFVGLAQFVPAVMLVLVSGWVADRFDRRRVSALFLFARVICAVGFLAYSQILPDAVWPLFAIAFVFGAADAMLAPSRRSIAPLLAPPELFPQVVALWTATFTASSIVGPVIGGFLYSIGPSEAYALAAVLELAAIVPILMIVYAREPERLTERPTIHTAMEGLRFVRRTPVVLGTISLDLFAVLFGGAIALIPAVASDRLGVGDIAYGWLRAAPGIGAALMALWLAVRPVSRRVGPTLLTVVFVFGAGTVVFGVTRNYAVAFVALVVIAAADMVSMFIRGSIVPLVTPDDQLGRVSAVEGVFIGASNELGAFESGVAARMFGVPWAIAGGGLITMGIAVSFAFVFPSIRRIDTFDELRPQTSAPIGSTVS
ncbi:MAG TPA: MFS transporter [Ilumatobacteraceae bacterium]|nr:MFS transporter [Ilumatobacteraceae bacterium]